MAQPITKIVQPADFEAKQEALQVSELRKELAANQAVLAEGLHLLRAMHERGLLELLAALFEQGDKVMERLVDLLSKPGAANGLKVMIAVADSLGSYDAEAVKKLLNGVSRGLEAASSVPAPQKSVGVFDLLKHMQDPDVSAAIHAGFAFLKGVGQSLRSGGAV
ncbi:DUF1641 domain-containing protein [Alicyclobacillus cycloheptanicus]|uniref:Uncharacterized protein YjgD (DUF1641 family) n=1 Tax=Alicyclobacillus cycloheptanicus TaxID=1457 RepID=A0ABT9XGR2_9BACL|nr:DUF1641 domain-containing protein [Alicyclobacillus cycloheptanicus]MDQ0189501.1 uncharacterized protein YjgD (DUF1641 family) [Alicyclobacillus cycloheptanicus]WDM01565.1 DUF1641 domain-containing protein [Alicyclobacillus cycloheptanicus]